MPRNLREAINLFESSEQSREFFGDDFVKLYNLLGRHEATFYEQTVTDWEVNRYIEEA